jgi:cytochrome c oxidase assembly factor CtaG
MLLAHAGAALEPHDLWGAWNLDLPLLIGVVAAMWAYRRGRLRGPRRAADVWRARCFAGALSVIVVALVSPLDALSGSLASAHMVQHVLLLLVAAPLLALASPGATLLRGSPPAVRAAGGRVRRQLRNLPVGRDALRNPAVVWTIHVATIWFWHAAGPYDAALGNDLLHAAEHATYVLTGLLFWQVVLGRRAVPKGLGILLVFTMAMQSVFLSALLTFASGPWYSAYASTTRAWNDFEKVRLVMVERDGDSDQAGPSRALDKVGPRPVEVERGQRSGPRVDRDPAVWQRKRAFGLLH